MRPYLGMLIAGDHGPRYCTVLNYATIVLNMRTRKVRSARLADVLFGNYRRQTLSLLLLHSDQSYFVREIARLTGVPVGSLHRELKVLAEAGLLIRTKAGNHVRYQVNRECPIFEELAGIFRKTAGLADVLRDALEPVTAKVSLAFIFGSFAEGNEQATSDVDVLVVGSASFASVVEAMSGSREQLRRDVNPVVMTRVQFRAKYNEKDRFVSRIVREPKIYLIGDAGELGKLTRDRAA